MIDDDLMTAARAEFAPVRMTTAADTIMARGRGMRRRRHSQIAASAFAVALGAGIAIPALTSPSTPTHASTATQAALTAWTVATQPGGAINVTIRELQDLPALQAKLTQDGARVTVGTASTTAGTGPSSVTPPAGCQAGPANPAPASAAIIFHNTRTGYHFTIQPANIPAGDMIRIAVTTGGAEDLPGSPALPGLVALLVHDNPGCGF